LHYGVADQTDLFGLSLVLDQIIGLIFSLRANSYLKLKTTAESLSSLRKLMKIRSKTEVSSKNSVWSCYWNHTWSEYKRNW